MFNLTNITGRPYYAKACIFYSINVKSITYLFISIVNL